MNQTLVTNVLGKNVYLVNNQNFSFYICTPTNGKASIILNLVDNVNLISMNNNLTNVTNEVTSIYNKFNFYQKCFLLLPRLSKLQKHFL